MRRKPFRSMRSGRQSEGGFRAPKATRVARAERGVPRARIREALLVAAPGTEVGVLRLGSIIDG